MIEIYKHMIDRRRRKDMRHAAWRHSVLNTEWLETIRQRDSHWHRADRILELRIRKGICVRTRTEFAFLESTTVLIVHHLNCAPEKHTCAEAPTRTHVNTYTQTYTHHVPTLSASFEDSYMRHPNRMWSITCEMSSAVCLETSHFAECKKKRKKRGKRNSNRHENDCSAQ